MREVFFSQEAKNSSTMLARYGKCRRRDGVSILGDRSLYRCQRHVALFRSQATSTILATPVESSNGFVVFQSASGEMRFDVDVCRYSASGEMRTLTPPHC